MFARKCNFRSNIVWPVDGEEEMVDTGEDGVPGGGQVAATDGGDAWQKNEQFPLDSKITFLIGMVVYIRYAQD